MKSIKNFTFILIILLFGATSCVDTEIDEQIATSIKQTPTAEMLSQDENFQLLIDRFQALSEMKKDYKLLKKLSGKSELTKAEEQQLLQGLGFSSSLAFSEFNKQASELRDALYENYDFQDFSQVEMRILFNQSTAIYKPIFIQKSGCQDAHDREMAAAYTEYYTDMAMCVFLAGAAGTGSGGIAGGIVFGLCWSGAELAFDGAETAANARRALCERQQ